MLNTIKSYSICGHLTIPTVHMSLEKKHDTRPPQLLRCKKSRLIRFISNTKGILQQGGQTLIHKNNQCIKFLGFLHVKDKEAPQATLRAIGKCQKRVGSRLFLFLLRNHLWHPFDLFSIKILEMIPYIWAGFLQK